MTDYPACALDDHGVAALRDLCAWVEEIATGWHDPEELVRLLDLSGRVLFLADDHGPAARYWMRALEIIRGQASTLYWAITSRAAILRSLSGLYHATQRPLKAVEVERELVSLLETAEPTVFDVEDRAQALTRLGSTLIETGAFDAGREVLTRADHALQTLGSTSHTDRVHARVLELLVTVERHREQPDQADHCHARATEMAARPLVPITDVIHEFTATVAETADQLATLAQKTTPVMDAIGDPRAPQLIGLAQVPGAVATWNHHVDTITNLAFHLGREIHIIARAAGVEITPPRQPTPLDALDHLTEWAATNARTRNELTVLIELRSRVARIFYDADDVRRAHTHWDAALATADELAAFARDPATASTARATGTRILETRSDLAHAHNRRGDAIDSETRLYDRHRFAGDEPATARALTRLGATMAAGQQYIQAHEYLTQADAIFRALRAHDPDRVRSHADTLDLLATVLDQVDRRADAAQRRQQADALRNTAAHPVDQT